jgi:hypothetical protein
MAKFDNLIVSQSVKSDRFWIIGDIHGMISQFRDIIRKIVEHETNDDNGLPYAERISLVSVGDLCDRGDASLECLHMAYYMRTTGQQLHVHSRGISATTFHNVLGNHDHKLMRTLNGAAVQPKHGLDKTLFQLQGTGEGMMKRYAQFFEQSPLTLRLLLPDEREAVVVHAGFHPSFQTFGSEREWGRSHTAEYALFGPVSGIRPDGLPIRIQWEDTYEGPLQVFYGHKIVEGIVPQFTAHACNVDTGCFQTGVLSAVSFPDLHVIQAHGEKSSYGELPIQYPGHDGAGRLAGDNRN